MAQQTRSVWSSHSCPDRARLQGSTHARHRLVRCSVDCASGSQDEHPQGTQGHRRAHPPHSMQWAAGGSQPWPRQGFEAQRTGRVARPPGGGAAPLSHEEAEN